MESKENPFISVVIPTYNRAGLLKKAVESVLAQTYRNIEVVIVDDGSTDNTKEVIRSFNDNRIVFIEHSNNRGGTAARNTGIKSSKGSWRAFLDSDDIWLETKLEEQVKVIPGLPDDYAVIHCGMRNIDYLTGKMLSERTARENINEIVRSNLGIIPGTPTMIIKKAVLEEIGLFNEKLPAHQESELGLRIALKYKFKLVDKILVIVNRNHNQIMSNPSLHVKAKELILEEHQNILSSSLVFNYCNIIAGDAIANGNIKKAKKY
ncbi:MAG: glycosyltransferase family 2 protein, partial [Ignavibacteriaceae bacterium]